jgi:hypothetical protein
LQSIENRKDEVADCRQDFLANGFVDGGGPHRPPVIVVPGHQDSDSLPPVAPGNYGVSGRISLILKVVQSFRGIPDVDREFRTFGIGTHGTLYLNDLVTILHPSGEILAAGNETAGFQKQSCRINDGLDDPVQCHSPYDS